MQNILLIKIFAISLSQKVKAILTNNTYDYDKRRNQNGRLQNHKKSYH